jgi:hypothetical protein
MCSSPKARAISKIATCSSDKEKSIPIPAKN